MELKFGVEVYVSLWTGLAGYAAGCAVHSLRCLRFL